MEAGLDLGKQDALIGDPGEAGGVGQEQRRLAPEHRNGPGIPESVDSRRVVYAIREPSGVNTGAYLRSLRRW